VVFGEPDGAAGGRIRGGWGKAGGRGFHGRPHLGEWHVARKRVTASEGFLRVARPFQAEAGPHYERRQPGRGGRSSLETVMAATPRRVSRLGDEKPK